MTTGEAVRAALLANATVAGLVGARVYPNLMPQGAAYPAVVFQVITDVPENALTGDASDRLTSTRLQIDAYAKTYLAAHQIADAIDQALTALTPPDPAVWRDLTRDLYDDVAELHRVSGEFFVQR